MENGHQIPFNKSLNLTQSMSKFLDKPFANEISDLMYSFTNILAGFCLLFEINFSLEQLLALNRAAYLVMYRIVSNHVDP